MARRVFQRAGTVAEIARRLGAGVMEAPSTTDGASDRAGGSEIEEQKREIRRLNLLVDGLCGENEQLWAAVEGLQATVERLAARPS